MQRTPYAILLIKSNTYKSTSVFGRQGPEVRTEERAARRQAEPRSGWLIFSPRPIQNEFARFDAEAEALTRVIAHTEEKCAGRLGQWSGIFR